MDASVKKRQNTLLASLVLSAWAPLATGLAVLLSRSSTQMADFIRRTIEFLVLLLSWLVFRYLAMGKIGEEERIKWEHLVNRSVAMALGISGVIMLYLAVSKGFRANPGGNTLPGLIIALLGFGVNFWFWRRYRFLAVQEGDSIMDAQRKLYLAKLFVDFAVIVALGTVALWPGYRVTAYVDTLGSMGVALYLIWTSIRAWRSPIAESQIAAK